MNETRIFRLAAAVLAVRVFDDTVLQPPAGVSIADRPLAALVPLALLALAAWGYPRMRGVLRGGLGLLFGVLGLVVVADAVYYASSRGLASDDVSGLLAFAAGVGLLALGAHTLWRTRRRGGWWPLRRAGLALAALAVAALALLPAGVAYVETHTARATVPANHLGVAYEDVAFESTDGLQLRGWYVPSRNGAAVIAFPGRSGPQAHARMLARHGYGVLLLDRRGEGRSEGQPNMFGWGGTADLKGAIAFLERRADVDPAKIGGLGLSVGGELMLQAAAETRGLAAVVSEGAGARTLAEELDTPGLRRHDVPLTALSYAIRDAALVVSTGHTPPQHLDTLVARIAPRPVLLIAAPNSPNGERLNRRYVKAAGTTASLWELPESRHIKGLQTRPEEYEERVVAFFDKALRPRPEPRAPAGTS